MLSIKHLKLLKQMYKVSWNKSFGTPYTLPYKINFDVTYKCNSSCRICNIWKIYKEDDSGQEKELSLNSYKAIFKNYGENLFIASFEGGEPFLRDDISDIVISAFENCKNIISVVIASNGLLSEKIEEQVKTILKFKSNIPINISLSLDGLKDVHNKIRGRGDSYDRVMETYKRLRMIQNPYLNIFFQTTICKTNWKSLIEMKKNCDCDFIFTLAHENAFFNNSRCNEGVFEIEDRKQFIEVIGKLSKEIKVNNLSTFLNKLYLLLSVDYLKTKRLPVKCNASFSNLSFDPYGNVSPCAFYGEKFGNIADYDYNLERLLKKENVKGIKEKIKKGKCPKCWMNCDALPSIIHSMPKALVKSFILSLG